MSVHVLEYAYAMFPLREVLALLGLPKPIDGLQQRLPANAGAVLSDSSAYSAGERGQAHFRVFIEIATGQTKEFVAHDIVLIGSATSLLMDSANDGTIVFTAVETERIRGLQLQQSPVSRKTTPTTEDT